MLSGNIIFEQIKLINYLVLLIYLSLWLLQLTQVWLKLAALVRLLPHTLQYINHYVTVPPNGLLL